MKKLKLNYRVWASILAIIIGVLSFLAADPPVRHSLKMEVKRTAADLVINLNLDPQGNGRRKALDLGPSPTGRNYSSLPMTGSESFIQSASLAPATGPLRVDPANPRYFTDGSGKAILLTGSHTWGNFQDQGGTNPPPAFDYNAYLNFLASHHQNFFRLWTWEQSRWTVRTLDNNYWFAPLPYKRTGPGMALDGQPKFDLTQFNQAYFDRLRSLVIEAGNRGIYVSIMLFDGWSVSKEKGGFSDNNPWHGIPFNSQNNINGINGDPNHIDSGEEIETLHVPAITALQEAYVRKIIDTVNDLNNVLYEICNESKVGDQTAWQYHMIDYIKSYEAGKPKQHPVGMTAEYPGGNNDTLFASHADWVSPNGDLNNPAVADGSKVILYDTDHLCGICGDRQWVWKSFTNGLNPIFMDGYDAAAYGIWPINPKDPFWEIVRTNLGYVHTYAERMNLEAMTPHGELASTGYSLANPAAQGAEYLVYAPAGGRVILDLSRTTGELKGEWFNPATGETITGITTIGGGKRSFDPPFAGDAVLYLKQSATPTSPQFLYLPDIIANSQLKEGCWPNAIPAGAIPGQPAPVFCSITNHGPDTSQPGDNTWLDEFHHGLSFADFSGTLYKIFNGINSVYKTIHWRHGNHWMVDIAPHSKTEPPGYGGGGAMLRPDQSFRFDNGKLIVEIDVAAGIAAYAGHAWPEIIISTSDHPLGLGTYGYEMFPGSWTLGCRLHDDRVSVCALMDDRGNFANHQPSTRVWEMSAFQQVGTTNYGGDPLGERGKYWRLCQGTSPDEYCRDRFRLEITQTSLTLYVNGFKYFEQTGIPPLPDALVNGPVYIYFASIVSSHPADTVRFHWDRIAINPSTPPSPAPGFTP